MANTIHKMHLHAISLRLIKKGEKSIETRLNDAKRSKIKVGDIIEFTNRSKPDDKLKVKVTERLEYKTFSKLFMDHPASFFGGRDMEDLMTIYKYYSLEDEKKYGVVGIRFELVK